MNRPSIDQQVVFLHCDDLVETAVFYEKVLKLPMVLDQGSCRIYQTTPTSFLGFCEKGQFFDSKERAQPKLTLAIDSESDKNLAIELLITNFVHFERDKTTRRHVGL